MSIDDKGQTECFHNNDDAAKIDLLSKSSNSENPFSK